MATSRVRRWWRDAGSAAQLGAVVAVVAAVIAAAVVFLQPLLSDEAQPQPSNTQANLAYAVSLPPVRNGCGSSWIVPGPVADGAKFPARQAPPQGTLAAGSSVQIVVQETTGRTVVVHSLRVQVVNRGEPIAGVRLIDSGCGGFLPISYLRTNLDEADPALTVRSTLDTGGVSASHPPFPWTVAENDPVSYSIQLDVTAAQVQFVFVIDWSWGDKRSQTTVDSGGRPFIVSSVQGVTAVMCPGAGDAWNSSGPANRCV